jgi:hypothetical protein
LNLPCQCEMKTCCHAEAPLSIQVWHPRKYCIRTIWRQCNTRKSSLWAPQLLPSSPSTLSCRIE